MEKWKWTGPMIVTLLGFHLCAQAEDQPKSIYHLDEVVVSATRSEILVFDAPQDVSVMTSEEIMTSPFERVEDIVRSVPGIYNYRHFGQQTSGIVGPLIMRGVGKNRVLMLVDGVPQNDNFNNTIAWVAWGHIPKETIERIEIIRGPTSTLYGSEGLGGMIHVITKKPRAQRQTIVRGEVGTAETYGGFGMHSRKIHDFGFIVAGGYEGSDGFYMTDQPESYNIKRYREMGKLFGKMTYDLSPSSDLYLAALYYNHETGKGREFFYDKLNLGQYWMNYSHKGKTVDLEGLLYLNRADKTAFQDTATDNYTSLLREENMLSTTRGADFQGTIRFLSWASLTLGAAFEEALWDYDNDYVGSARDAGGEGRQRFLSPFANADLRLFSDSLIFTLGARYDWIETSDGANWDSQGSAGRPAYDNRFDTNREESFSPKIGIAYHPDDRTTIRASGGKGFRAPSLFELYKVHVRGGGTYYREANPDLKPEKIWSYDVGAERFLFSNLWAKGAFYQSFGKDYIGDRLIGTGEFGGGKTRSEYMLDNISEVDIHGIEAELQWYPTNDLTISFNYTYNISKVARDENNADLEGNYLPNDPRHNVNLGVRYQNPEIVNVTLRTNYCAGIYYGNENTLRTGDYWTVDVGVSRRVFGRFSIYVNAENIFDKQYPIVKSITSSDTIAPGVIVTGGVKSEF